MLAIGLPDYLHGTSLNTRRTVAYEAEHQRLYIVLLL